VLGGIFNQLAKGLVDALMLGLGLNRLGQRQRLEAISDQISRRWMALWRMLQSPPAVQRETPIPSTSRSRVS
jgi:hypothetical protein